MTVKDSMNARQKRLNSIEHVDKWNSLLEEDTDAAFKLLNDALAEVQIKNDEIKCESEENVKSNEPQFDDQVKPKVKEEPEFKAYENILSDIEEEPEFGTKANNISIGPRTSFKELRSNGPQFASPQSSKPNSFNQVKPKVNEESESNLFGQIEPVFEARPKVKKEPRTSFGNIEHAPRFDDQAKLKFQDIVSNSAGTKANNIPIGPRTSFKELRSNGPQFFSPQSDKPNPFNQVKPKVNEETEFGTKANNIPIGPRTSFKDMRSNNFKFDDQINAPQFASPQSNKPRTSFKNLANGPQFDDQINAPQFDNQVKPTFEEEPEFGTKANNIPIGPRTSFKELRSNGPQFEAKSKFEDVVSNSTGTKANNILIGPRTSFKDTRSNRLQFGDNAPQFASPQNNKPTFEANAPQFDRQVKPEFKSPQSSKPTFEDMSNSTGTKANNIPIGPKTPLKNLSKGPQSTKSSPTASQFSLSKTSLEPEFDSHSNQPLSNQFNKDNSTEKFRHLAFLCWSTVEEMKEVEEQCQKYFGNGTFRLKKIDDQIWIFVFGSVVDARHAIRNFSSLCSINDSLSSEHLPFVFDNANNLKPHVEKKSRPKTNMTMANKLICCQLKYDVQSLRNHQKEEKELEKARLEARKERFGTK